MLLLIGLATPVIAQDPRRPLTDPPAIDTIERNVGVLQPGDLLKIAVYRQPEFMGDFVINSRGDVQMPGVGVIHVAGSSPEAVTEEIRQALLRLGISDPSIAVQPVLQVSVLGHVGAPGLVEIPPGTNLIQLLTLVGGPLPDADLEDTRVIREGEVYHVDMESALEGSAAGRIVLYSNDIIAIPEESGFNRETVMFILSGLTAALTVYNVVRGRR